MKLYYGLFFLKSGYIDCIYRAGSKENLEIADMHHVDQKSEYHRESSGLC